MKDKERREAVFLCLRCLVCASSSKELLTPAYGPLETPTSYLNYFFIQLIYCCMSNLRI